MVGRTQVMLTRAPASYPMKDFIKWLSHDRLLTTGDKVRRYEPDGSMPSMSSGRHGTFAEPLMSNGHRT